MKQFFITAFERIVESSTSLYPMKCRNHFMAAVIVQHTHVINKNAQSDVGTQNYHHYATVCDNECQHE